MQSATCKVACGGGPAPPQVPRPKRSSGKAGLARVAAPSAPLVLERSAAEPVAGPSLAGADAGQPAGACSSGSTTAVRWQQTWRQHLQQQWQRQQHGRQQHAPEQSWVLQDGCLLLAGPTLAPPSASFEGRAPAATGSSPSPSSSSLSSSSSSSSSSSNDRSSFDGSDSTALGVQLNDPPPRQTQQGEGAGGGGLDPDQQDFFANVGDAIRTLREDYPLLFVKDLNYSIYRDDLTFKDPNLSFHGLKTYRAIFWGLRFHGKLLLQAANVRVLRIWQPEDAVIKLRWQINATPRLSRSPGTFDGISIYRLDRRGKVYQHEVTDVQLRDPPITNPLLYGLNFILSPRPQVQQVPCPGSWFVDGEEDLPDVLATAAVATSAPGLLSSSSSDHA